MTVTDTAAGSELTRVKEKIDNLRTAMESSRMIAVAIGITMERFHLDSQEAFELLRSVSQNRHRKMRDIASGVVFSGEIPTRTASE